MAKHLELGKQGEDLAAQYLKQRGYNILHRNWRFSHYEIDLIAEKDGMLHFFEVKMRSSAGFGMPEESVTAQKRKKLHRAMDEFLFQHPGFRDFRFNVLSILRDKKVSFYLIQDVHTNRSG